VNDTARERGFTLLEMLVATTLVCVLAGSLYASLRVAFKARNAAESAVGPVRKAELTLTLLEQDFRSATLPKGALTGAFVGENATDGDGNDNDSVSFCCTMCDWRPPERAGLTDGSTAHSWCDVRRVELSRAASDEPGGQVLVRQETANLLSPQGSEANSEVLCRGVKAFNVRYYDGAAWQESWDSSTVDNAIPLAVEITIELDAGTAASSGQRAGYRMMRSVAIPCGAEATQTTIEEP